LEGPGSSVGIATDYRLERFSARPDQPWSPPNLLQNGYCVFPRGKVWLRHAADHSPPPSAAVMEKQSYTCTHPLGHTGPVMGSL